MQELKDHDHSSIRRAVFEKSFLNFGKQPQTESSSMEPSTPPPMMISKMMRILSSEESLMFVPNPAHDYVPRIRIQTTGKHALGDCKLQ